MKKLLIATLLLTFVPHNSIAEPADTAVTCQTVTEFMKKANQYQVTPLMVGENDESYVMVYINQFNQNWVLTYVPKNDMEHVCVFDAGNGFDFSNKYLMIETDKGQGI